MVAREYPEDQDKEKRQEDVDSHFDSLRKRKQSLETLEDTF